jgi:ribosome maturation factor RimP
VGLCPLFLFGAASLGAGLNASGSKPGWSADAAIQSLESGPKGHEVDTERLARVRAAAERVARSYGLEIFDLQLRREPIGMVLRVIIDRPDRGVPERLEESIGIADCQRVSQDLSAILDVEEDDLAEAALGQEYTLEVSSPGLDRPLRHEADYRRFTGRLAKVVTKEPMDGQSAFAGRIVSVEDGQVTLEQGRKRHRVPVARIKRGNLDVEF